MNEFALTKQMVNYPKLVKLTNLKYFDSTYTKEMQSKLFSVCIIQFNLILDSFWLISDLKINE